MRKKIIISILLILTIFQAINPLKINAFTETREIISVPAKIEHQTTSDDIAPSTGIGDTIAGLIIEPTIEFFTFFIDAIMSVASHLMMPSDNGIQDVMVGNIDKISDIGEASTKHIIKDIAPYKNGFGILDINYPNFTYSTEDIFAGRVELLNVDFISGNKSDGNAVEDKGWIQIRSIVSQWYKVLRMISIIGLLSVLIYTGIKIILASNAQSKAKYKEMIVNWFVAVLLAFSLHYIMAFIMNVISIIMSMLGGLAGVIEVSIGDKVFNTNLIGLARFQMQQQQFSAKLAYLIIYTALVVYTFKFTFVYLKRVIYMAFLTIISPIVALTYPIDKMEGKAKGFEMWLKEYMYNALLQPMHYILYYVLVTTSLALAANNPLYGIVALAFISQAEKLLKKIFGIDKAKEGTVNGLARSFSTGALVGYLNNAVRDPLHPFAKGKKSKSSKGNKNSNKKESIENKYINNPKPIYDNDWSEFDGIGGTIENPNAFLTSGQETQNSETQPEERQERSETQNPYGQDEILDGATDEEKEALARYLAEGYGQDEFGQYFNPYTGTFDANYIPFRDPVYMRQVQLLGSEDEQGAGPQYTMPRQDAQQPVPQQPVMPQQGLQQPRQPQSTPQQGSQQPRQKQSIPQPGSQQPRQQQSIPQSGSQQPVQQPVMPQQASQQPVQQPVMPQQGSHQPEPQKADSGTPIREKAERLKRGMKAVGKQIARPVWDFDRSGKYNGKRLARGIVKGVLGASVGIATAAVQAGISITDGKYKPAEGIASFAAGYAAGSGIVNGIGGIVQNVKYAATQGDRQAQMERAQARFGDRQDVILFNRREFPKNPEAAMQRQRDNYLPYGITDLGEMKRCMKYANVLIQQFGFSQEDADRRAAATFEFRKTLQERGQLEAVYNKKKRDKYIKLLVEKDVENGTEEETARRRYLNAFRYVQAFDEANA